MPSTGGHSSARFTYDFGISIAQSTVSKIVRLTGVTMSLASAFYALKTSAAEYVDTLRKNTLAFGGVVNAMKAMEQAQDRLIQGKSYFAVDDQLRGMERLRQVGVDVKDNLDFINKAAHATGKSYAEFSNMIASAIQGNTGALVEAGLMTQRAAKMFDKYQAGTVMRQQAILNFVKTHKGLMSAIKNDFETVKDQVTRIKEVWRAFLQSVIGNPKDPDSFYGQIVRSMKMVAVAFARNVETIKRYGYVIGQVLGWVIKQIGHFVVWLGGKVKWALTSVWKVTDDFQTQTRSLLVWLEFWKLKVLDFFKTYKKEIKAVLLLLLAFKALKTVFVIGRAAIASVTGYWNAIVGVLSALKDFGASLFGFLGKAFGFLLRGVKGVFMFIKNLPSLFMGLVKAGRALIAALLGSNPVGWVILVISLLVILYTKCQKFRIFINNLFKTIWEWQKMIWNSLMYVFTWVMIGCKKAWAFFKTYIYEPVANFFKSAWQWIKDMWRAFKDSSVGRFIDRYIVQPLKGLFEWIVDAWNWLMQKLGSVLEWFSDANDNISAATEQLAKENGVVVLPTFKGGDYDTKDDTNYINPGNWGIFSPDEGQNGSTNETTAVNPLMGNFGGGGGNTTNNNMNFSNGAIQIVVNKGDNLNERELAKQVRSILYDMKREGDMRGGNV